MATTLIHSAIFGFAVGDALGVPVEFKSREYLQTNPITGMIGYGSHNQPPGTWSDDTSMMLCTLEALIGGYDLQKIADNFVQWFKDGYWTPYGDVFDIGGITRKAILNLSSGKSPHKSGLSDENPNGNGSLMRILPIAFILKDLDIREQFRIIREVSSITHSHIRSVLACFFYVQFARNIINGLDKYKAYNQAVEDFTRFCEEPVKGMVYQLKYMEPEDIEPFSIEEIELTQEFPKLKKILYHNYPGIDFNTIKSSGYVIDTLDSVVACIVTTTNYKDAVLKAVNLGGDTDTIAALTGGLSGLLYGYESIPKAWIDSLARKDDIEELCGRFENRIFI